MSFNKPNNINNVYDKYNDVKLFNNKILKKWNMYEKQFKQFQYLDYNDVISYPNRIIDYIKNNSNIDISVNTNMLYEFQIINNSDSIFTNNFNNTKIINIINKFLYKYICIYEINNMPELKFCILYYDSKIHNEKIFNYDTDNIIIFFIENEDLKILNSVSESYEFKKHTSLNSTYKNAYVIDFINEIKNNNNNLYLDYEKIDENQIFDKLDSLLNWISIYDDFDDDNRKFYSDELNRYLTYKQKIEYSITGYWTSNDLDHVICLYASDEDLYIFKIIDKSIIEALDKCVINDIIDDMNDYDYLDESYEFKKPKSINDTYVLNNLDGKLFVFIDYKDNPNRYKKLYDNALNANKYSQTIKYLNTIGTYVKAEHEYEYKKINKNCRSLDLLLPTEYKKFNFKCIGYWLLNDGIHIVCSYAPGDFSYSLLKVFKINELNFKLDESYEFNKPKSINASYDYFKIKQFIDKILENNNYLKLNYPYSKLKGLYDILDKNLTYNAYTYFNNKQNNLNEYKNSLSKFLNESDKKLLFRFLGWWNIPESDKSICLWESDKIDASLFIIIDNDVLFNTFKNFDISKYISKYNKIKTYELYEFKKPTNINNVMDPVKGIEKYIDKLKSINTDHNYDYKLLYSINNDYSINLNSMLKIEDPNFEFDENYKIRSAHNLVIMNNKIYTELPDVSPNIISGSFSWINGNLINTKNIPDGGSINLSNNNISDLSGLPNVIYGKLFLDHNNITNINWNVEKICGDLHLEHNPISIKSLLNNIPIILGNLYIDESIISNLNSNEYKILTSHVIGNIEKI